MLKLYVCFKLGIQAKADIRSRESNQDPIW